MCLTSLQALSDVFPAISMFPCRKLIGSVCHTDGKRQFQNWSSQTLYSVQQIQLANSKNAHARSRAHSPRAYSAKSSHIARQKPLHSRLGDAELHNLNGNKFQTLARAPRYTRVIALRASEPHTLRRLEGSAGKSTKVAKPNFSSGA
jgi:hypothetical protein